MPIPVILAQKIIAQAKQEILQDITSGFVPAEGLASFANLHDYQDANCYGGLCDDEFVDGLIEQFGGRDEHEGMPQGLLDLINAVQDALDAWIKAGLPA